MLHKMFLILYFVLRDYSHLGFGFFFVLGVVEWVCVVLWVGDLGMRYWVPALRGL